jgi:hypothetical protein
MSNAESEVLGRLGKEPMRAAVTAPAPALGSKHQFLCRDSTLFSAERLVIRHSSPTQPRQNCSSSAHAVSIRARTLARSETSSPASLQMGLGTMMRLATSAETGQYKSSCDSNDITIV